MTMNKTEECLKKFAIDNSLRYAKKTILGYLCILRGIFSYVEIEFDEVTSQEIKDWLSYLKKLEYKPSTTRKYFMAVKTFYQYCVEERLVLANPVDNIPYPQVPIKLPYYLELEQINALRQLVEDNIQERAIIEVLYSTGVRKNELLNIRIEHINWSERSILIPDAKGGKERIVLFTNLCGEYVQKWLKERTDKHPYLFRNKRGTRKYCRTMLGNKFKEYREQLGFYVTPHTLRHTFAAHLAQKGMPLDGIQALLGHENPKNTEIYARLFDHARKDMYDKWM